jgi:uncharacterized protein
MYQYLNDVQKKRLFNSIFIVLILLAVFLAALSINTIKEGGYIGSGVIASNVITVSGQGEVLAVPDTGTLSFSVVETGKTVGVAQDLAAKKVNAVIDAIKVLGVDEKDIKTEGYNSYPKYEYAQASICANGYCPPSKQILTGYEVNQTVSIKIRKTADAGAILTKVGTLGVSNISSLDFIVDNSDALDAEARDKAISDAKSKAQVLAKSLGVRLGKVVNFSEGGRGGEPIYYSMAKDSVAGVASAPTVPQLPTGQNKIVSNVSVTYEIK